MAIYPRLNRFKPSLTAFKAPIYALTPCLLALSPLFAPTLQAQQAQFADHASIDRAVEAFTQMPIGAPGGARAPVDRRFRLAACRAPFALRYYGSRGESVQVECPDAGGWRIFVPLVSDPQRVDSVKTKQTAPKVAAEIIISRGDRVTITVEGSGFSVSQMGEALESGALGTWIKVKPPGKSDPVRARIDSPGRVTIPLN